ncbi:hypothetical protein C8J56DRAFT_1156758 [Mycena floridula]|nr:hypothetical protein C8J56DRAFT_1156758 [Mycena floridula]
MSSRFADNLRTRSPRAILHQENRIFHLAAHSSASVGSFGIDELAVYWVTAVVSPHQIVRALLSGKYEARSSWLSVARNLTFKLIFDLAASPEPDSMVAGKLAYIATNTGTSNLMLHRPFLTYRHLGSS